MLLRLNRKYIGKNFFIGGKLNNNCQYLKVYKNYKYMTYTKKSFLYLLQETHFFKKLKQFSIFDKQIMFC